MSQQNHKPLVKVATEVLKVIVGGNKAPLPRPKK